MATSKQVGSQLTNMLTYKMYLNDNLTLAKNVFLFDNMPDSVNMEKVNSALIEAGAVAFFVDKDENLEDKLYALPFNIIKKKKPYNEPYEIEARGEGGYKKKLKYGEFVIMYDNNSCSPILLDIMQYSERLALCTRVSDININNQKIARIWEVPQNKIESYKQVLNSIDSFEEKIFGYEGLNIEGCSFQLPKVDYIADKVDSHKDKIYQEFLNFIGISTIRYTKKERMLEDEISNQIGGAIAKRYSRFEPRNKAVKQINEKFKEVLNGKKIILKYYDGVPASNSEEGGSQDVVSDVSNVSNDDRGE